MYTSYDDDVRDEMTISSETETMTMKVSIPSAMLVISGDGQHKGECLGVYGCFMHGCFNQATTSDNATPRYLYPVAGSGWYNSDLPGKEGGWLKNESKSETVPTTGWKWADGKGGWHDDPTIKITPGKMQSLCETITIQGQGEVVTEHPSSLGTFTRTDKWFNGLPVFINDKGGYLHSSNANTWSVGSKIGGYFIRSTTAPLCPAQTKEWVYWTGKAPGDVKPATITVTCNTTH
mgnify:CR=1 FL=1